MLTDVFEQAERTLGLTLYTEAFIVRGDVQTRRRRLSDVLNDPERQYVVLRNVELTAFGLGTTGAAPLRSEYAQVNFDAVLFALASERIEPSPEMRVNKHPERAFISIPPFAVVGRIHLMPEPDLPDGLDELTARFIPVTDVTFHSDTVGVPPTTAPMIAVNHARAQILAPFAGDEATTERDVSEEAGAPSWS